MSRFQLLVLIIAVVNAAVAVGYLVRVAMASRRAHVAARRAADERPDGHS